MGTLGTTSYRILDQNALHFITITTVEWVDVFTRIVYKNILIESLEYCRKQKGLELYAYVIMSNHIHLICRAKEGFALSDILRDFKKYTAKQIIKELQDHPGESRRTWLLAILREAGRRNKKNKTYQLWRLDNHPILLFKTNTIKRKLDYIHKNPVKEGIVANAEDYLYSSARNYAEMESVLDIELL